MVKKNFKFSTSEFTKIRHFKKKICPSADPTPVGRGPPPSALRPPNFELALTPLCISLTGEHLFFGVFCRVCFELSVAAQVIEMTYYVLGEGVETNSTRSLVWCPTLINNISVPSDFMFTGVYHGGLPTAVKCLLPMVCGRHFYGRHCCGRYCLWP